MTDQPQHEGILRIFISYRREDATRYAGDLFRALTERLPDSQVFWDIGTIEPGVDFVEEIQRAVGSCDVLLAVIGRQWLEVRNQQGQRRLDDPSDFVRLEVTTAVDRNIRLVPVLVQGASMPRAEDLPESMVHLARRNATELSDTRWDYDIEQLVDALRRIRPQPLVPPTGRLPSLEASDEAAATAVAPSATTTSAAAGAAASAATPVSARPTAARLRVPLLAGVGMLVMIAIVAAAWLTLNSGARGATQVAAPTAVPVAAKPTSVVAQATLAGFSDPPEWPLRVEGFQWIATADRDDPFTSSSASVTDGVLTQRVQAKQQNVTFTKVGAKPGSSFQVAVDGKQVSAPDDSWYGVVFRFSNDASTNHQTFYSFVINEKQDQAQFRLVTEGKPTSLHVAAQGSAMKPGDVNRFVVRAEQGHYSFMLNGQGLFEADNTQLADGAVGLYESLAKSGDSGIWEYDSFKLFSPQ